MVTAEGEYLYGHADMNYRSPEGATELPADTTHGRAPLPSRPGVGWNVNTQASSRRPSRREAVQTARILRQRRPRPYSRLRGILCGNFLASK
jgi:hypothetical protein